MTKIFMINAHEPEFGTYSPGKLNQSLFEIAASQFLSKGFKVKQTWTAQPWDIETEVNNQLWCDYLLVQSPVKWMSFPWSFKKYIDQIYTKPGHGKLWLGTGRSRQAPEKNYGTKGGLIDKKYMFSLTFDAPEGAFDDPNEYLMQGRSVDDLFFPMHVNYRYLAMKQLPTFSMHDVIVNPNIDADFARFADHINKHIIRRQ